METTPLLKYSERKERVRGINLTSGIALPKVLDACRVKKATAQNRFTRQQIIQGRRKAPLDPAPQRRAKA